MRQETFTLSQKELQRVTVIRTVRAGEPDVRQSRGAARAIASPCQTPQIALSARQRSGSGARQPRPAQPPPTAGSHTPGCPAPGPHDAMPASTIIICTKNSSNKKASPSAARPCAASCEPPGSARPENAGRPLIASAACAAAREGELVQLDGSPHDWLKAAARSSPLWACRTTPPAKSSPPSSSPRKPPRAISDLLQSLLRRFGVPLAFYGDRSGIFIRNDDHWSLEEQLAGQRQPTQFGRALDQLGITFIAAQSPRPKAASNASGACCRIASPASFAWLRPATSTSANAVLRRFVADYNRRFARTPREAQTAWRPAPENLDRICCFTHERIVSNDNVVQWDGRRLQIHPQPRRFSFAGAKVQICQTLDGRVSLYYGDTRLEHSNLAGG